VRPDNKNEVFIPFKKRHNEKGNKNQMDFKKNIPYAVACFVIMAGVLFCISALVDGLLVDVKPHRSHYVIGISIIFIGAGIYYLYLLSQGKLKKSGKSIVEVRQEAVERMDDPVLLARIASGDEPPEVRTAAKERLEELHN
jgi:hypothetical protein